MLKFPKTSDMFRSPYGHPTGRHWHNLIHNACPHISYIGVHVMVHSVTLARTDILPEDGLTVTETCRRFYEILAFNV